MAKPRAKKIIFTDLIVLVIVAVALAVSMAWSRDFELALGLLYYAVADSLSPEDVVVIDGKAGAYGAYAAADGDYPELKLHFVDVGQGDCTIIELPDGGTMIIDGGDYAQKYADAITDYIEQNLPADFEYFDYAILTHPDADHCGSLDNVLKRYPARVAYRPNVEARNKNDAAYVDPGKADLTADARYKTTLAYRECIDVMYAATDAFTPEVRVTDPADDSQTISGGDGENAYTYTFYSPLSHKYGTTSTVDWNEYSPIMILEYRGFKFALSGDAEKKNEAEFVAKVEAAKTDGITDKYDAFTDDYTVNLVKAGHHGSRTSTSQGYLDAITTPEGAKAAYYIISCGEDNKYGHPHPETLDRLGGMNVPESNILRTDVSGDLPFSVKIDSDGVYRMFYGDTQTSATAGVLPSLPNGAQPEPEPEPAPEPDGAEKELVLVYREWNGIELTWAFVAWSGYACLAILVILHAAMTAVFGRRGGKGRRR